MKTQKDLSIPKNYKDALPELRGKTFDWNMEFSSKTRLTTGNITHYSIRGAIPFGNLVLVPGLASNTQTEPLMCALTYWALTHKYNVYAIDTFLGDFKPEISDELAAKHTLPEFIDLVDVGMNIVEKMSINKWNCVIGHSLGGAGILSVFNRRITHNLPIGCSAAVLFAPFVTQEWHTVIKNILKDRQHPNLSQEEFYKHAVGLVSPHILFDDSTVRYVSIFPKFYDDTDALKPCPELMAKYDIPTTLVAGGKDRKAPIKYARSVYNSVLEHSSNPKINFVEFPESKHSFMNQHNDWSSVLKLIKSQYIRTKGVK